MNHIMVDIETWGTSSDAPIISIGGVLFDDKPFKNVKIDTIVREAVIERKSPGLLMITKNLMRSKGI